MMAKKTTKPATKRRRTLTAGLKAAQVEAMSRDVRNQDRYRRPGVAISVRINPELDARLKRFVAQQKLANVERRLKPGVPFKLQEIVEAALERYLHHET